MTKQRRLWALTKLLTIAIIVAGISLYYDVSRFFAYFNVALLASILVIQPLVLSSFALVAKRYAILARTPPVPFFAAFRAVMLSTGLNVIIPGRIAELLKATYLRTHAGIPLSSGLAAIFLERLYDLIILGFMAIAAIGLLVSNPSYVLIILMLFAVVAVFMLPKIARLLIANRHRLPWPAAQNFVGKFLAHATGQLQHKTIALAFLYGAVAWAVSFTGIAILLNVSGSIPIGISGSVIVFAATTLGGGLPALPGGIGTYETAAVLSLSNFGYGFEEALALAIAMHVSQLTASLLAAMVITVNERTGLSSLIAEVKAFAAKE